MKSIDLTPCITPGIGLLVGEDRGKLVRSKVNLDKSDRTTEQFTVVFPDFVYSINSSFFRGLFENSLKFLGEENFKARYLFSGELAVHARDELIRLARLYGKPLVPNSD